MRWRSWGAGTAHASATIRTDSAPAGDPPEFTYTRGHLTATGLKRCGRRWVYTKLVEKLRPNESTYTENIEYQAC